MFKLTAAKRAAIVSLARVVPCAQREGADADATSSDPDYLVLTKPNVIMDDIRLSGLAVAGNDAMTPTV
jgi:hypothetical protein